MYVIEKHGKLYGPFESYQAAALASGANQQAQGSQGLGLVATIREVLSPMSSQDEMMARQQNPQGRGFGNPPD